MSDEDKRIAVIGAGTMGHGIAQVAAAAGYQVVITDAEAAVLQRARERISSNLQKGIERGKVEPAERDRVLRNLSPEQELAAAVTGADVVIEAVVEDLAVKREICAVVEREVGPETLLASNTSSLPLAQIAAELDHPGRVIGMHFFNPVHIMALLEVVVHPGTDERTRERALAIGRRMGKDPIVVRDSPGFASSRLGVVLGLEAMRMVEQGVASAADIDKAMELGYRHPMGPLKLTDVVGLDVRLAVAETLFRELGGEQYRPPQVLRDKVAAGELGKKSGQGFHRWDD